MKIFLLYCCYVAICTKYTLAVTYFYLFFKNISIQKGLLFTGDINVLTQNKIEGYIVLTVPM